MDHHQQVHSTDQTEDSIPADSAGDLLPVRDKVRGWRRGPGSTTRLRARRIVRVRLSRVEASACRQRTRAGRAVDCWARGGPTPGDSRAAFVELVRAASVGGQHRRGDVRLGPASPLRLANDLPGREKIQAAVAKVSRGDFMRIGTRGGTDDGSALSASGAAHCRSRCVLRCRHLGSGRRPCQYVAACGQGRWPRTSFCWLPPYSEAGSGVFHRRSS